MTATREGIKGLVLDLRNNGEEFEVAIDIASIFKGRDEVLFADAKAQKVYRASAGRTDFMVVLVNQDKASASEILATALQDNGRQTWWYYYYGKGLVQTVFP